MSKLEWRTRAQSKAARLARAAELAGILARPVYTAAEAATALGRQLAEPILWARTLDVARELGATVFLELGPGRGLTAMARERFPELPVRAVNEFASLEGAVHWLRRQL